MRFQPRIRNEVVADEEYDDLAQEISMVDNNCPKCQTRNALIIMYRKDKFINGRKTHTTMKISCMRCDWKTTGNYKI